MPERFSDRQSSVAGLIFLVPMVLLVLLDSGNVLNPWSKTAWLAGASLVLGVGLLFLPYTAIECTEEGFTVLHGPGKGRRVLWQEVNSTQVSLTRKWTDASRHSASRLVESQSLALAAPGVPPVVLRDNAPFHQLIDYVNSKTRHLSYEWVINETVGARDALECIGAWTRVPTGNAFAAVRPPAPIAVTPSDDVRRVRAGTGGSRTRNRMLLLVATTAAAAYFAPWDPSDPDMNTFAWIVACLPAVFLVPLTIAAAASDYGPAAYDLASSGQTFTIARRRFGRGTTVTGDWSRVTQTRYDIGVKRQTDEFVVELQGVESIIIKSARLYPGLVTWISERAPLPYEWIATADAGGRRVLENNGPYSRVARTGPSNVS